MSEVRCYEAEERTHDDFGEEFTKTEGEIVYDARTLSGPWALMTEKSYEKHGIGRLGVGFGQRYERRADGSCVKIEG